MKTIEKIGIIGGAGLLTYIIAKLAKAKKPSQPTETPTETITPTHTPTPISNITFNVVNKSKWYVGIAVMDGIEIKQAKIVKSGTVTFSFPADGEYLFNFYLIPTQNTPLSSDYLIDTKFYKTGNTYTFEVLPTYVVIYIQPWEVIMHLQYKVYIDGKDYGYITEKNTKLYAGTHNWKIVIPSMTGTKIHSVYVSYKDKPLTRTGTFDVGVKPDTIFLRAVDEGTGALALNIYLHGTIKVQLGDRTWSFDNNTYIPQYGELHVIDIPEGSYNLKVFQDKNLILDKDITIKKDKTVDMLNYVYEQSLSDKTSVVR